VVSKPEIDCLGTSVHTTIDMLMVTLNLTRLLICTHSKAIEDRLG